MNVVGSRFYLDTFPNQYPFVMEDASYTRESYPLVLDFGKRKDTITLKKIGFNSCTGPINEVGKSAGVKEVTWNKIILDI